MSWLRPLFTNKLICMILGKLYKLKLHEIYEYKIRKSQVFPSFGEILNLS